MKGIPPHKLPAAPMSTYHFHCINCGYDVYGLRAERLHRCPECGETPNYSRTTTRILRRWLIDGFCLIILVSFGTYELTWLTSDFKQATRNASATSPEQRAASYQRCREESLGYAVTAGYVATVAWLVWGYCLVFNRTKTRRYWQKIRQELSAGTGIGATGTSAGTQAGLGYRAVLLIIALVLVTVSVVAWNPIGKLGATIMRRRAASIYAQGASATTTAQAVGFCRRAAELGDTTAMVELGDLYIGGSAVPQDYPTAANWYKKAAGAGDRTAMVRLGDLYATGRGVRQNDPTAEEWYRKAAELGDAGAMVKLGDLIVAGRAASEDRRARRFLQMGRSYWPADALGWYKKAERLGDTAAMVRLADAYLSGPHRRDSAELREAVKRYILAAGGGCRDAMVRLARLYTVGQDVERNDGEAVKWFSKAAELGDPTAMLELGTMYFEGYRVKKDDAAAATWLRKAAEKGNQDAKELLRTLEFKQ